MESQLPSPLSTDSVDGTVSSKFLLVTLTSQRAKQLENGARSRVDAGDHKCARVAMIEVLAGLVSWSVAQRPAAASFPHAKA